MQTMQLLYLRFAFVRELGSNKGVWVAQCPHIIFMHNGCSMKNIGKL